MRNGNSTKPGFFEYAILLLLAAFLAGFLWINIGINRAMAGQTHNFKITAEPLVKNGPSTLRDSLDTWRYDLALTKAELKRIESVNDKRFEVLGWGLSLLLTAIGGLFVINYVNSRKAVRDMVYDELKNDRDEYIKEMDETIDDFKMKRDNILKEVNDFLTTFSKKP